jgi:hypothetical protein
VADGEGKEALAVLTKAIPDRAEAGMKNTFRVQVGRLGDQREGRRPRPRLPAEEGMSTLGDYLREAVRGLSSWADRSLVAELQQRSRDRLLHRRVASPTEAEKTDQKLVVEVRRKHLERMERRLGPPDRRSQPRPASPGRRATDRSSEVD